MHRLVLNVGRCQTRAARCTGRCITSTTRRLSQQAPKQPQSEGSASARNTEPPPELNNIGIPPTNFSKPTLTALNFWFRFAKFSFIGFAVLAGGAFAALEGTHYYVEHFGLAPPSDADGELERCGWIKEMERWTGGREGGTDPALGSKAKYALRSAWITQHWGTGAQVISASALAHAQQSPDKVIEARLEYCHDFLTLALALALESERDGKQLRPETVAEIMAKKAATLERIGSKGALYDARATYENVWDKASRLGGDTDSEELARLALKLGDVNARLGDADEAYSWWSRALRLSSSPSAPDNEIRLSLPSHLPPSPHAQRTIAATLSSLSAFYAQSGHLEDAKAIQDTGVALLVPLVPVSVLSSPSLQKSPEFTNHQNALNANANADSDPPSNTNASKSPPQTLHDLYLQHRLSLLALHRAEVSHALRSSSPPQTLEELAKAAIEAEDVVFALSSSSSSSSPGSSSDANSTLTSTDKDKPVHKAQLDATYEDNRALKGPASSLLRDARRTALHAWTLSGILHENAASSSSSTSKSSSKGSSSRWRNVFPASSSSSQSKTETEIEGRDSELKAALRCYARALAWAGASSPSSSSSTPASASSGPGWMEGSGNEGEPSPSRDLLPSEWRALWEGYVRTRDAVLVSAAGGKEGDMEKEKEEKA